MDLSALPRMSATDVVTATLVGIDRGEVIIALGVRALSDNLAAVVTFCRASEGERTWPNFPVQP